MARVDAPGPRRGGWPAVAGILGIGILVAGIGAVWIGQAQVGRSGPDGGLPSAATTRAPFPIVAYQGIYVLGAEELDFWSLLGTGTPVVLNFWAGQCPPCRVEMPDFQRVHDRHEGEFLLVGVDIGPFVGLGSHESARALLTELGITYPTAFAVDAGAVRDNDVLGMPTTIFFDGEGVEVDRVNGLLSEDAFERHVLKLVASAA